MANFDVAVGINQQAANGLLSSYYSDQSTKEPFKGEIQQNIDKIGQVTLDWDFTTQPNIIFGAPSLQNWQQSLGPTGDTNQKIPLPTDPMIQLIAPSFTGTYTLGQNKPVGGPTQNVQVYGTLDLTDPKQISAKMVGVFLNENDFTAWDKTIFNKGLLPLIFNESGNILKPIQFAPIEFQGISLKPSWGIQLSNNQLIGAAVLSTNSGAVDINGVTWPTDSVFILASRDAVNEALVPFEAAINKIRKDDGGDYKSLATWSFSGQVVQSEITVQNLKPQLTFIANCEVNASAHADINDGGLAETTKHCPLSPFYQS